jgi:phage baseplate assembly protein W
MTTVFDRPLAGFRYVRTRPRDTLQRVALRELGDASQWASLISINKLEPPYLTDDATLASDTVFLNGSSQYLIVPAATAATQNPDPTSVFGTDIALDGNGLIILGDVDMATVSGPANLEQALNNALATDQGELLFHPTYGTLIRRILGATVGPTRTQLAASYAQATVIADARISTATATATASGDSITVTVDATTVNGESASASATT